MFSYNSDLKEIPAEIVRWHSIDRVVIGLDFFDASINRVAAWVIGVRNMQKALLTALLTPWDKLRAMQDDGNFTGLLAWEEEMKLCPVGDVWNEFCQRHQVARGMDWLKEVRSYEEKILPERA